MISETTIQYDWNPKFLDFEVKITIIITKQAILEVNSTKTPIFNNENVAFARYVVRIVVVLNHIFEFRNQNDNFQIKTSYFLRNFDKNAAFMLIFNGKNDENAAFLRYVVQIDKYVKLVVMYVIFIERRNDFKQKLWFLNF